MAELEPKSRIELPADSLPPPPPAKMTGELHHQPEKQHPAAGRYGHGHGYGYGYGRRGSLSATLVILVILAGITALTVWLLYRPYKPKFRVVGANVYQLNTSSPPFVSATIQLTVVTRNPNNRVSIYYDHLSAYVSYKEQPITAPVSLPPLVQETKSTVALSPVLGGSAVPVVAEAAKGLQMDQNYGVVGLRLVLTGNLRYKGGAIWSRRNGVYVKCNLYLGGTGTGTGTARSSNMNNGSLPLLGSPPCTVDV